VSQLEGWLDQRLARAPASLRQRIEGALSGAGADLTGSPAGRLQAVAERLLQEAKVGPATRDTAMTLLAADALITLACEWTAEFDPAGLRQAR
jgi:hypothetical protein